jgi:TfoX/Sxy family transcriptional regulator of competence genes
VILCGMSFEAVLQQFEGEPGVEQGTGFRSPGLRVNGKIFAMLVDGELVVKLPRERCEELVAAGGRPFRSGGREMREWVVVQGGDWVALAEEAHAFVSRES